MLGHIFAVTTVVNNSTFNEDICISSGFMLGELVCSQGIIVIVIALSGIHVNFVFKVFRHLTLLSVADSGFPVGGLQPVGGAPTSDADAFR